MAKAMCPDGTAAFRDRRRLFNKPARAQIDTQVVDVQTDIKRTLLRY
jgi:hypothetical protein